ncbi:hypothetical protein MAH1_26400 [Sessilibacter sp. MAH1]
MLYSMYADTKKYLYIGYDAKQIMSQLGDDYRFDIDRSVKPYSNIWQSPINVNFGSEGIKGTKIPDISVDQGRLFLNTKAYDALYNLLKNDGEFLPVIYELGEGFMFNPLSLANSESDLDLKLCVKNEWGDVENIAFNEDSVKRFTIFKTEYDRYYSVYCQDCVKTAVEKSSLKGVIFTPDLGNYLGTENINAN